MFSLLSSLLSPACVSGDERGGAKAIADLISPMGEVQVTQNGSVILKKAPWKDGAPVVMLQAHLDRIGFMVTRVMERGFVRLSPVGGVDRRAVAGARVTLHAEGGDYPGVICAAPPHLVKDSERDSIPKADAIFADMLMDGDALERTAKPGDIVTLDGDIVRLLGDRVCAAAIDDRAGCAAVVRAAQLIADDAGFNVAVALCSQEEVGSAGAATAAFGLSPDVAIASDVSMAITPGDREDRCGRMDGGPMVGFSPILDRGLSKLCCSLAGELGIPFQREIMAGRTGTDADHIAVSGSGVRTALVSIPIRFMHTQVEVVSLGDIENTARLIAALAGGAVCRSL